MPDNLLGLLFEISADPSKAEAAISRFRASSLAGAADVSKVWSGAMNAVTGPTGIALGAVVGLGGGMLELASKAAEVGAKIYEAHEKTGLASRSLSGLMAISIETKGNFEGLTTALARASVNLEKTTQAGGKANRLLYDMMGGAKGAAELGLKPMDDRVQSVLKRIFALNDVGQRNTALSELMGRGWMNNVDQLQLLAEQGYAPAIEQAKKFGVFYDDNAARQAKQFQVGMATLRAELSSLALVAGQKLIPFWIGWDQGMAGMIPHLESWGQKISAVAHTLQPGGIPAAIDLWTRSNLKMNETVQTETDFLVRLDAVTRGAAKAGEEGRKSTVAHTKALKEEKTETAEVARLFGQLSLAVATSDAEYREYLKTLNAINRIQDDHSRIVLAMLNDERLALELDKRATEQTKEQAEWSFKAALATGEIGKQMVALRPQLVLGSTAMGQLAATSRVLTAQMKLQELPARQQIEISVRNRLASADREIAKYHQLAAQGKISFRELQVAEADYTAAKVALQAERTASTERAAAAVLNSINVELLAYGFSVQAMRSIYAGLMRDLGSYLSGKAKLKAAEQFAEALSSWPNYWAMAQHFAAAAAWTALGVGISGTVGTLAGQFSGGAGGGGSVAGPSPGGSAGGTVATSRALAPGAAGVQAAARAAQAPQPIIIQFNAPVYGGPAGLDELSRKIVVPIAKHLSSAVINRDVRLVSSHAVNPVPVST